MKQCDVLYRYRYRSAQYRQGARCLTELVEPRFMLDNDKLFATVLDFSTAVLLLTWRTR